MNSKIIHANNPTFSKTVLESAFLDKKSVYFFKMMSFFILFNLRKFLNKDDKLLKKQHSAIESVEKSHPQI